MLASTLEVDIVQKDDSHTGPAEQSLCQLSYAAAELAALWQNNRAALVSDYQLRKEHCAGWPAHMKIELTNYCNLACTMCPHEQMQREVGYMKPALFRKIIDESAPHLEFAYLHHLGESLFHPRIGELIRYGRSRGAAMGLSTNASYLDQRKGRLLLESSLDFLVISLDGVTPETYERIRIGGDFQKTLANVRDFLSLKEQLGSALTVVVQMIVLERNRHEVERFAQQWNGQAMIKEARDWAGQVQLGRQHAPLPAKQLPCRMPWTELTVLWDGTVVPCVNVYEKQNVLGDLRNQSVQQVWNSPAMLELRDAHVRNALQDTPVCATCPRHELDGEEFVRINQLMQRRLHYARTDLTPRPGLS